jgi:urease accessory protein UreF
MYNLQFTTTPFVEKTFFLLKDTSDSTIIREIINLDKEIDTFYSGNSVLFNASKTSGLSYLTCTLKSQISRKEWLQEWKKLVLNEKSSGNFPIAFTIMGTSLNLSLQDLVFSLLFTNLKNLVSAAIRLNVINSFDGLRLLLTLEKEIPDFISSSSKYSNTCPLLDIYQGRQEYLYSKLFHS